MLSACFLEVFWRCFDLDSSCLTTAINMAHCSQYQSFGVTAVTFAPIHTDFFRTWVGLFLLQQGTNNSYARANARAVTWPITAVQQLKKIPRSIKYWIKNKREEFCCVTWILAIAALCLSKIVISISLSWQLFLHTTALHSFETQLRNTILSYRSTADDQCLFTIVLTLIS